MVSSNTCLTCRSLQGEISISPGSPIYSGTYWRIEHAYPTAVKGWLVIVLKRHVAALHDLDSEEFEELTTLLPAITQLLRTSLGCEKEYVACFAEGAGFRHIHVHCIARMPDLPTGHHGAKIFNLIGPNVENPVDPQVVSSFCDDLKHLLKEQSSLFTKK